MAENQYGLLHSFKFFVSLITQPEISWQNFKKRDFVFRYFESKFFYLIAFCFFLSGFIHYGMIDEVSSGWIIEIVNFFATSLMIAGTGFMLFLTAKYLKYDLAFPVALVSSMYIFLPLILARILYYLAANSAPLLSEIIFLIINVAAIILGIFLLYGWNRYYLLVPSQKVGILLSLQVFVVATLTWCVSAAGDIFLKSYLGAQF
jgi:hypothetical protein